MHLMLHAYVRIFDVTSTVEIFSPIKHGPNFPKNNTSGSYLLHEPKPEHDHFTRPRRTRLVVGDDPVGSGPSVSTHSLSSSLYHSPQLDLLLSGRTCYQGKLDHGNWNTCSICVESSSAAKFRPVTGRNLYFV